MIPTRRAKVGQQVGGMYGAGGWVPNAPGRPPCGHRGCTALATEVETFRIKTPPGSRYRTKLTTFDRCDEHEHSHWRRIGYDGR